MKTILIGDIENALKDYTKTKANENLSGMDSPQKMAKVNSEPKKRAMMKTEGELVKKQTDSKSEKKTETKIGEKETLESRRIARSKRLNEMKTKRLRNQKRANENVVNTSEMGEDDIEDLEPTGDLEQEDLGAETGGVDVNSEICNSIQANMSKLDAEIPDGWGEGEIEEAKALLQSFIDVCQGSSEIVPVGGEEGEMGDEELGDDVADGIPMPEEETGMLGESAKLKKK